MFLARRMSNLLVERPKFSLHHDGKKEKRLVLSTSTDHAVFTVCFYI
jgi:hypothetical protein